MARGSGAGLAVVLTVARRAGSSAGAAAYDPPHAQRLEPLNAPPLASGNVSVSGASFGAVDASPGARLGGSACLATRWASDSALQCRCSEAGVRKSGRALAVTVASGVGTSARLFSFDAPYVTGVARVGGGGPGASADVLLFGRNFGTADHSFAARLPPAGCNSTVWVADSAIRCRLPGGPPQVHSHLHRRGIEL